MSARLDAALAELADALREEVRAELDSSRDAPERLLGVDEAATILGIGRSRVYDELAAGRLASVKVGRRRLIPASAIERFIAAAAGPRR